MRSSIDAQNEIIQQKEETKQTTVKGSKKPVKGLTEQAIKKNTLDNKLATQNSATNYKALDLAEIHSQSQQRASLGSNNGEVLDPNTESPDREFDPCDGLSAIKSERLSQEYSQNVEVNSCASSEIKYLFGQKLDEGVYKRQKDDGD